MIQVIINDAEYYDFTVEPNKIVICHYDIFLQLVVHYKEKGYWLEFYDESIKHINIK